jgi:CrcB protein
MRRRARSTARSADGGRNWTETVLPVPAGTAEVSAVAAAAGGFTATGTFGATAGERDVVVWTSRDGTTWRASIPAGPGGRAADHLAAADRELKPPRPGPRAWINRSLLCVQEASGELSLPVASRRVLPRIDRREIAAIFAGGALGTLARAALAEAFPHAATAWPWPTFGVNIAAAFALGYFVTRLQERLPLSSYRRPLLGTGLCGGLSTFSTMQVELLKMLDAHAWGLAAGYAAASIAAGYAAIGLATALVRRVRVRS